MKLRFFKSFWFVPVCIVVISGGFAASLIIYKKVNEPHAAASGFYYDCEASKPESVECQQKTYATMVKKKGVEETYKVLKADYAQSASVKSNCHQLTHAIGREAAFTYKTIEGSFDHGDNFCWSGYYHGVMEMIAKDLGKDKINDNLTSTCANVAKTKQYSFYHFNCVHGLGHGLMAVNSDELFEVLKLCDKYSDDWEARSCYGGAYMENIMAAQMGNGKSKYLKEGEPLYPCTAVEDKYKYECYLMQTSHALQEVSYDYAQVFALCETTADYKDVCNQSMGRDASGNSTSDVKRTTETCMLGPNEAAQKNCFIGAVKDFISYYHSDQQAGELCAAAPASLQPICNTTKTEYYQTL